MNARTRMFFVVSILALAPSLSLGAHNASQSLFAQAAPPGRAFAEQSLSTITTTLFLPLIAKPIGPPTVFGYESVAIVNGSGLAEMTAAHSAWARRNGVLWSDVEPAPGVRAWTALAGLEQEMINAWSHGMRMILVVRGAPVWARSIGSPPCAAILPGQLGAFGTFMRDLVARYSLPPYNVHYWEIWNEPDVDPSLYAIPDFGCWGDNTDPYYGGGYFAQMLQTAYPQIKASDPTAEVIVGGLLLDCNPTAGCLSGPRASKFLEGILRAGGGVAFDAVAFHAYDYYYGSLGQYGNSNWTSAWNSTGPSLIAKARFIKQQLSNYGTSGKRLYGTETAILCVCASSNNTFELTKAYYVTQSFAAAMAEGLQASSWFAYFSWWRYSGLFSTSAPVGLLPAYTAYRLAGDKLGDATFSTELTAFPSVKGYALTHRGHALWLVWSLDGATHPISLPATPTSIVDALGNPVSFAGGSVTVSIAPLFIELP